MKTCLFLEDTPGGLKAKLIWQVSGHQDHAPESIAMMTMSNLMLFIKDMENRGLLKIAKEEVGRPGEPPEASRLS
jgi:hypothetical protein